MNKIVIRPEHKLVSGEVKEDGIINLRFDNPVAFAQDNRIDWKHMLEGIDQEGKATYQFHISNLFEI